MDDGSPRPRNLEERTFLFAQSIRGFVRTLPRTVSNTEDVRQLVRASGSVAANWIEADEALSKKDFLMRAKICGKEAKESRLFLRLIEVGTSNINSRDALAVEAVRVDVDFFHHHFKKRWIMSSFGILNIEILPGIWALGFGICKL